MDDDALLLDELHRLETERKLRAIPDALLQTAWVRDAQVEAVIDAVLAVKYDGDARGYAGARHVGEWCARIAHAMPDIVDHAFARRAGVLSRVEPEILSRLPELRHLAPPVRGFQASVDSRDTCASALTLIIAVASDFEKRLAANESPRRAIAEMCEAANFEMLAIVQVLWNSLSRNRCQPESRRTTAQRTRARTYVNAYHGA